MFLGGLQLDFPNVCWHTPPLSYLSQWWPSALCHRGGRGKEDPDTDPSWWWLKNSV